MKLEHEDDEERIARVINFAGWLVGWLVRSFSHHDIIYWRGELSRFHRKYENAQGGKV